MDIRECIRKNELYVHKTDDAAFNPEREIALIKDGSTPYEFAFRVGVSNLYNKTEVWKMLYPVDAYNEAWTYVKSVKGKITSVEDDFDAVMKDENLSGALGSVRINRINFEIKTLTNGKDCEPCEC